MGDFSFLFSLEGNISVCRQQFSLRMGLNGGRGDCLLSLCTFSRCSILGFFNLGTADILGWIILCRGAVLSILECWAASLAYTP